MESIAQEIAARRLDPYAAVERTLGALGLDPRGTSRAAAPKGSA
jgi:hypothetical protein